MERLTTDKTAREMTMTELAHNCMYTRERWSWYRDFDREMDLFDFIREFGKAENSGELPYDNEVLEEMLLDGLQYSINNPFGRVALVYRLMWAMANLRETLKAYEDTGLTPQEITDGKLLTGWIFVEERLPEEPNAGLTEMEDLQEYIVMIDGAELPTVLSYAGNGEWYRDGDFYKVLAWMPLPEPYRPEDKLTEMEGSHE